MGFAKLKSTDRAMVKSAAERGLKTPGKFISLQRDLVVRIQDAVDPSFGDDLQAQRENERARTADSLKLRIR